MKLSRIKNQMVITALVLMIAGGGYLSFRKQIVKPVMGETASGEARKKGGEEEKKDMEDAGEAIITTGKAGTDYAATARLNREQAHAKAKEELQQITENEAISKEDREKAAQAMIEMAKNQEAEVEVENLLLAKGFKNVVVSILNDSVDVVVDLSTVSDAQLAQISEIVTRKVQIDPTHIVITPMRVE